MIFNHIWRLPILRIYDTQFKELLLRFEHNSSEGGEGDLQGLRMSVTCDGFGLDGAEVAHVAAAIAFGVAVDEFAVGARGGYAYAVVFSWDGGKVAGKN